MADIRQKAAATAYDYNQGNIAVLDDDTTRRLVASVALTESRGGNPELTSRQGFVGTYQHGAQALAHADFVDSSKLNAAMSGFKSEWSWANTGGMTQFLETRENWKHGMDLERFKQSPELQNEAFKRNAERAYERAVSEGVLKEGDKQEKVAGFLKVEHVMGYGHAKAAANGERVFRSPDGTSNYDYLHDITRDRDGLTKYLSEHRDQIRAAPDKNAAVDVLLSNPNHPQFERYQHCFDLLKSTTPFESEAKHANAAGYVAMRSLDMGMHDVHAILENSRGELFPTQDLGKAYEKTFKVERSAAESFSIEDSTRQVNQISQQAAVTQDNPQQVRAHSL